MIKEKKLTPYSNILKIWLKLLIIQKKSVKVKENKGHKTLQKRQRGKANKDNEEYKPSPEELKGDQNSKNQEKKNLNLYLGKKEEEQKKVKI